MNYISIQQCKLSCTYIFFFTKYCVFIVKSLTISILKLNKASALVPCCSLGRMIMETVPACLRLASDKMSITNMANSLALSLASFCLPWLRVAESSGLTGKKGTMLRSSSWACLGPGCTAAHAASQSRVIADIINGYLQKTYKDRF